jgi:type VI protein secretion system component Hcp
MNFELTDDQRSIQRTARDFLASSYPPAEVRRLAYDTERGFEDAGWALGRYGARAKLGLVTDGTTPAKRTKGGLAVPDCIQDLSLTKFVDSATPDVIMDAVSGRVVPGATLSLRKAGKGQQEYLVLQLSNVLISSYSTGGSGGEDRITENITLHFSRMEGSYRRQKADGTLDAPVQWVVAGGSCR